MIRLASHLGDESCDLDFAQEVKEKSQAHLERCYQCLICSSGCCIAFAMDYTPNQIIRMVQFGLKERVMSSSAIWVCASCEVCATRCPNEIDIVRVMDTLRELALKEEGVKKGNIPKFHFTFLERIRSRGKVHELSLVLGYFITSGYIFKIRQMSGDIILGLRMFLKGKLALLPGKIKGLEEIRRIFKLTE